MSSENKLDMDPSVLQGFLEESREALASLDAFFIQLEKDPFNSSIISSIFRPVHSIKGNAPFFGLMRLKTIAHEFESLLAALRDKKIAPARSLFDLLLAGVDEVKAIVERVARGQPEVIDEAHYASLISQAKQATIARQPSSGSFPKGAELQAAFEALSSLRLSSDQESIREAILVTLRACAASSDERVVVPSIPQAATAVPLDAPLHEHQAPKAPSDASGQKKEAAKSMRVSEERIDTFLGFVGELVIAQDMLRHFSTKVEGLLEDPKLKKELDVVNGVILNLGNGLERAIMSIRKVSVKSLLQKAPRLIRDVAIAKGKEIAVEIEGDEVEIDKSLLELLDAPITHMVRNAADHGIELPEARERAGKPRQGTVKVVCSEGLTDIVLTVKDDGAGLNYQGLQKKAEALGLVRAGEGLTDAQVVNLIFMAGVSTASEVSDISGRGVGMDVVKRNVEASGGSISVTSSPGMGSEFMLRLPKSVTTQIMQGFVVRVHDVSLVLPLNQVQESWSLRAGDITDVVSLGPQVIRHEKVLPLLNLPEFLHLGAGETGEQNQLVVTIDSNSQLLALRVDDIIGPRQVVLKPLDASTNGEQLFLGGALLGDGTVALVLDVAKLHASAMSNLVPEKTGLH